MARNPNKDKRYPLTTFYIGNTIGSFLAIFFAEFCLLMGYESIKGTMLFWVPQFIFMLGFVPLTYMALTDFFFGWVRFSDSGVTMRHGIKKYEYSWSDFSSAGIAYTHIQKGKYVAWVYFSKTPLTMQEQLYFLPKTRRQTERLMFFQYNDKTLAAAKEKMPEELREILMESEREGKIIFRIGSNLDG